MKDNKLYNPFMISGYYTPDYFCDREDETEKLISALENGRNVSLMSPRRYGKTGLIHHVFYKLKENAHLRNGRHTGARPKGTYKDIVCIYLDIFSTQNFNEFASFFAENVLGKLDDNLEKTIKSFASFFKSFRPTLTYDTQTGQPEISVKIEKEASDKSLQEIFSYLKQSNKRCYIAIDEFQQVTEYPQKGIEALLRSYIQFLPNVKFIFSGSKQHLMSEIFLSAKRPFYQSTQIMTLDTVNIESYFKFAKKHFQKNKFILSKECFEYIYNKFEGITWFVQVILNRLYEYRKNINKLDIADHAINEIIEENTYAYRDLLNAYSDLQVNLIKAVAKERVVKQISSGDFINKYGFKNASSISRALEKLLEKELIYKSERGYCVYDRFLGLYLFSVR